MREHDEEDLPILDAVVRGGDAAIIRSLRLGRETLAELETLRRAALEADERPGGHPDGPNAADDADPVVPVGAAAPARPGSGDGSPVFLDPDTMRPRPVRARRDDGTPIDVVLERHVDALRRELRELLGEAPGATRADG